MMRTAVVVVIAALALAALGACASGRLRLESRDSGAEMSPRWVTAVYSYIDENTVDIILSDIAAQDLASMSAEDLMRSRGAIVHIHQFFTPVAGRTALDSTASNATVRHIVLAGGEIGVYGGGGLLLPGGAPGGQRYAFSMTDASMRLVNATPGFVDRLGAASMSGGAGVARDDDRARAMARVAQQAVAIAGAGS